MNKGNDCLKNLKLLGDARQDIYDAMSGYCGIHVCCFEAVDAVIRKLITNMCGVLPPQPEPIRSLEYPGGYTIKIYGSGPKYDGAPFYFTMDSPHEEGWSSSEDDADGFESLEQAIQVATSYVQDFADFNQDDTPF